MDTFKNNKRKPTCINYTQNSNQNPKISVIQLGMGQLLKLRPYHRRKGENMTSIGGGF